MKRSVLRAASSNSSLHLLHSPHTASSSVLPPCACFTLSTCPNGATMCCPSGPRSPSTAGAFGASAEATSKAALSLSSSLDHKTAPACSRVDDLTGASPLSIVVSAPSAPSVFPTSLSAALSAAGVRAAAGGLVAGGVVGALPGRVAGGRPGSRSVSSPALEDVWGTAPGSANSCRDAVQLADPGRKRLNCTVATRSAALTVDTSPALAAGTHERSASAVHVQQQVAWHRLAKLSGPSSASQLVSGPGPGPEFATGPGPGPWPSVVSGSEGDSAASPWIPRSLMVQSGHYQVSPLSLGWKWLRGSSESGVWVLKGDAQTFGLPENLEGVGVVWEHRSGHFNHRLNPPFLQRRLTCGAGSHPF